MKSGEIKDIKTRELMIKYPSYRDYKKHASKEGGWGTTTLETRYGGWNKAKEALGITDNLVIHNSFKREFSVEDILECMRTYETRDDWQEAKKAGAITPSEKQIQNAFGSWTDAKIAAGFMPLGAALDPERATTVYLVWFVEEDIFKVGITQRSIKMRFSGYPEYYVVDSVSTTLEAARALEKATLEKYKNTKAIPSDPVFQSRGKGGFSECFYCSEVPSF